LCDLPPERRGVDEVDELLLAVDLDDRDQLAESLFQIRIAVDSNLLEFEFELVTQGDQGRPSSFAEVATLRAVEPDAGYG
jgi:hypothetical protein